MKVEGDDNLVGSLGKDDLFGGSANKVFTVFTVFAGSGNDRIRGFKKWEDKIDTNSLNFNSTTIA